jgi:hypothetical protein
VEDNLGRLPVHVACDRDAPWMDMLEALVDARPESLNQRDGGGRLPLHVVLDRQLPSVEVRQLNTLSGHWKGAWCVLETLLSRNMTHLRPLDRHNTALPLPPHPRALPLPLPLPQVVRYLVRSNPAAASARRGVGRLPVHYACFADEPDVDIIRCLLEVDYRPV